ILCNNAATTRIATLSLHDALPIWDAVCGTACEQQRRADARKGAGSEGTVFGVGDLEGSLLKGDDVLRVAGEERDEGEVEQRLGRSEEHTFELQSQSNLVCRLLLEK